MQLIGPVNNQPRRVRINPTIPRSTTQRYTPLMNTRSDIKLVGSGPITGKIFSQQKTEGPKYSKGAQEIGRRMRNRIVPL
jgi:hypothetical protein